LDLVLLREPATLSVLAGMGLIFAGLALLAWRGGEGMRRVAKGAPLQ